MTRAAVRERAQARRAADAAFREAFDAYMFECFAKPGFKLESEAQLAERFGVTRYKVRKAIEALNQAGVLERVKHGGSTVRSVTPEELADRADRLLSVAGRGRRLRSCLRPRARHHGQGRPREARGS